MKIPQTFIYATIAIAIIAVFQLKKSRIKESFTSTFQPKASLGYAKNTCVMKITDNRGEEFTINYKAYRKLFAEGGYNSVIKRYYNEPSNEIFNVGLTFQPSFTRDADSVNEDFETSYTEALLSDTLYQPTEETIGRAIKAHKPRFGSFY